MPFFPHLQGPFPVLYCKKVPREEHPMNYIEERIREEGCIKSGDVLKVDAFLNHQVDMELVEKAAEKIDQESAMNSMTRMMSGEFNFNDFLQQMRMMQSLGPLEGLLGLLPGFSKIKKQLPEGALDPKKMKRMEAIVLSMTPAERANYKLLIPSRRRRIAKGSGVSEIEVNRFIKNFKQMKEMMKQMESYKKTGRMPPGFPGM